ncbi:MAG: metal ABC transporter permease [Coprococcus sp.]|nr:ABC transporter [Coprococcus sp.]
MRKVVDRVQLVDKLIYYMQYPFVKYALVVGILIALCSSLFGATLVLKRFSFIGDGLSHVAFGAMAIGSVLKLTNNTIIVMPVTVAAAILILMSGQNAKLKGDAAIAMMSVGALAVGYLIMNVFSTSANVSGDVCSTLFGSTSILTLTMGEVWLCIVMSICVIAFFCLFYNRIFAVTFDESFTRAIGKNAGAYNLALAVIIAVIIVLAMNLVGSLLITALLVFPALSAMRVMYSFRSVVLYSAVLSVVGTLAGMLVSILFSTPVGSTIVACDMVIFAFNSIAGKVMRR